LNDLKVSIQTAYSNQQTDALVIFFNGMKEAYFGIYVR